MAESDLHRRTAVDDTDETDEEEEERRRRKHPAERIKDAIWTVLWLIASGVSLYQSDIVGVLLHSQQLRWWALYIAFSLMSVTVCTCTWLSFKFDPVDFNDVICDQLPGKPPAIPLATACWVIGSSFLAIGLWPVYHVLTLPLLFVTLMGLITVLGVLPVGRRKED
eukprot:TRINITY_DN7457_c0_g1_i1.p1 TRINITY_DN7457_c0_g1~~TRINITY_DN7457_c0_g1_i1.p1  ORF type:complete len:186 (+),score=88.21 TRINITY_DN7457_c0_g1_i1:61-558(+)